MQQRSGQAMLERLRNWRLTRRAHWLAASGGFADCAELETWLRLEGHDARPLADRRLRARLDLSCGTAWARR